jgi:hypothetical protein
MLVVGTRQLMNQLESPVHINFMGENLTPVTELEDLGMLLDSHLTYDKHIQALSSSCISKLRQIGRVKHNFDQSTPQAAQSYPVLLITLYLYINNILKIIRKSCVINLLRYIFI